MKVEQSRSEEETVRIGEEIGRSIRAPRVILLYGELGAGKTLLTRGLILGLGVSSPDVVHSPSFTLVNQYEGEQGTIYHVDLYRLEGPRDLYSIGIEDILAGDSVAIVEWAEKLLFEVENPLKIRISVDPASDARRFEIEGL